MATDQLPPMAKTRALLTETEREQIAGEHTDRRKYEATSRARRRIKDELTTDVAVLAEHHPDLLAELRAVVCDGGGGGDAAASVATDAADDSISSDTVDGATAEVETDPAGRGAATPERAPQDAASVPQDETTPGTPTVPPAGAATREERARAALEAVRAAEDHDWSDETVAEYATAVAAAIDHLEAEKMATAKDFIREVALDHPIGYKTDPMQEYVDGDRDRYRGAWWRTVVQPALKQHPEVRPPEPPRSVYKWDPDDAGGGSA